MTKDEFWAVVADTRKGVDAMPRERRIAAQNHRYEQRLGGMTPDELVGYKRAFEERMREANTWDLLAAAALICDGCKSGMFRDFRAWLIAKGREAFEAAVKNPDSLLGRPGLSETLLPVYPAFWSTPWTVYHKKTGHDDFPDLGLPPAGDPTGVPFDEEDDADLRKRCPKLFVAYRESD